MTPERWQQVEDVYHTVMARPERERAGAVAELCSSDETLGNEVKSLLGFLETPALGGTNVAGERPFVGRRFGSYSVRAPLGVGGMGEVYRAHDERLGRDVAIKILPQAFSSHPERLARFEREARMLAALNHPHIGAIYGLEDVDGSLALVLELVEGETLAERIAKRAADAGSTGPAFARDGLRRAGPGLQMKDALTIARQIAEALEAAHERGIIHRDLKPANIKITPGGVVKVLDLGLAKLGAGGAGESEARLTESPRVTAQVSRDGLILGTIAYMSPEQAAGEAADKRSDLWAFGVVLLEMLTGRPVFTGETELDVLATVLKAEPDWTMLPAGTPAPIRALLRRCLTKDRERRLDSAAAARVELDTALAPQAAALMRAATSSRHVALAVTAILAGIALVVGLLAWIPRPAPQATGVLRLTINTSPAQPFNISSSDRDLALSPDGRRVVYRFAGSNTNGSPLMVRAFGELAATPLPGIGGAYAPFFSPDGRSIGFFENGELKRVSLDGGPVTPLCPVIGVSLGASWGDDNTIVFATDDPGSGLWVVSADGGKPRVLTSPVVTHPANDHAFPSMLPGGRGVLFTITTSGEEPQVAALDLRTGVWSTLLRGGSQAEYVDAGQGPSPGAGAPGHLIYAVAGTLRALRFDPDRLEPSGEPVTRDEGVMMKGSGAANYAVSRLGTLVYIPRAIGEALPAPSLVWVDRSGHEEKTRLPPAGYGPPRLSPDNTRLAITVFDPDPDIAVWDFARETLKQLTFESGTDSMPLWAPDSQRIIFMSDRERTGVFNFYSQAADGTGDAERLTWSNDKQWPTSIHGTHLFGFEVPGVMVVRLANPATACSLNRAAQSMASAGIGASSRERQVLFAGSFPEISPDCRYLAYQSNESGKGVTIDVRPFPDVSSGHWQVSQGVGTRPAWAHNGRELFYLDEAGAFTVVPVDTFGPTFLVKGNPATLFDTRYVEPNPARHYDVSADDQRFLMIKGAAPDLNRIPASLVVVEHWIEEVKERVR